MTARLKRKEPYMKKITALSLAALTALAAGLASPARAEDRPDAEGHHPMQEHPPCPPSRIVHLTWMPSSGGT